MKTSKRFPYWGSFVMGIYHTTNKGSIYLNNMHFSLCYKLFNGHVAGDITFRWRFDNDDNYDDDNNNNNNNNNNNDNDDNYNNYNNNINNNNDNGNDNDDNDNYNCNNDDNYNDNNTLKTLYNPSKVRFNLACTRPFMWSSPSPNTLAWSFFSHYDSHHKAELNVRGGLLMVWCIYYR